MPYSYSGVINRGIIAATADHLGRDRGPRGFSQGLMQHAELTLTILVIFRMHTAAVALQRKSSASRDAATATVKMAVDGERCTTTS